VFTRNTGLQNQPVVLVQDGLAGRPRELLDPNRLAPDGTVALTGLELNVTGTLMAYALSRNGSDRQEIFVRDVDTAKDRSDRIRWAKFASIVWLKDSSGFYYTSFPEPGTVPPGDENYSHKLYSHRLGSDQSSDIRVFEHPDEKAVILEANVTWTGRYLVITAFKGSSDRSEVYLLDLETDEPVPIPIFTGFTASYRFIEMAGDRILFQTDHSAPLGRIIAVDPRSESRYPEEVIPGGADKLSSALWVQETIVASYLHHASSQIRTFTPDGERGKDIELPGTGSVTALSGRPDDTEFFVGFTSFTCPEAAYRYEFATGKLTRFGETVANINSSAYETKQVWYPSRDGTKISMFLVHKKGLPLDGVRPVLLSGYGGFNISQTPSFNPGNFAWFDSGGVFALANLRGGGEYGEEWHRGGMLGRKQNVFDDLIGAADWLIAKRYTSPGKLGIEGTSNGGLLVGVAIVQRPDLFGAAICRAPVADMLRYHLFGVGRFWISEYGSSEDAEQFQYLYRYSPYHNVKDGMSYPATLVMTADADDRVDPGMARKFAARLQEATAGPGPILIRTEMKAGHGGGKPISKQIDEDADMFAFLFKCLGEVYT